MANRRLQCRQLFWRNGWSTASERAGCAPTGQPARTVAQQRRPARSVGARGGHEGPASTRALTPRLSPLQRYPNPPSLASADVTLRPVRAGTRDDDTPAVAGHERRLRRDPPLRGFFVADSHAAVSRRLQGRVCCHSPEGRPPRPLTRFAGTGPLGARKGAGDVAAGRIERSVRPLPVAGAGLDQTAQRLVCGAALRAILDGHLIASQADRAVDIADGTGPASSRTPHTAAEQTGSQVLRAPSCRDALVPSPGPPPGARRRASRIHSQGRDFPRSVPSRVHFSADLSDR